MPLLKSLLATHAKNFHVTSINTRKFFLEEKISWDWKIFPLFVCYAKICHVRRSRIVLHVLHLHEKFSQDSISYEIFSCDKKNCHIHKKNFHVSKECEKFSKEAHIPLFNGRSRLFRRPRKNRMLNTNRIFNTEC